jgi:small-conductance mechanosensitive channel
MTPKISHAWIPADRIEALIQLEPFLVIVGIAISSYVFYRLFFSKLSELRHKNLGKLFNNLWVHLLFLICGFGGYWFLNLEAPHSLAMERVSTYVGLATIIFGAVVLIKSAKILLFEWLFLNHMKEGVPVLLVNIFTLGLSILVFSVLAGEVFNIRLGPFLATSAALTVVIGLAVQDTLGNLFAGVALQIDKPYEIGDWIEIQSANQKWSGQVLEVSWRATVLTGWADETLTIPNRVLAQAQISNFSFGRRPIVRSQVFRLPHDCNRDLVRRLLLDGARSAKSIAQQPGPLVLINETHESWIPFKLVFFVEDFGAQWISANEVIENVLDRLKKNGIELARSHLEITKSDS